VKPSITQTSYSYRSEVQTNPNPAKKRGGCQSEGKAAPACDCYRRPATEANWLRHSLLTTTAAPWTAKDTVQCTQNLHLQAQVALAPIIPEGKPWGISVILLHIKTQLKKLRSIVSPKACATTRHGQRFTAISKNISNPRPGGGRQEAPAPGKTPIVSLLYDFH